jgi:release factor glutamine methyltransferase
MSDFPSPPAASSGPVRTGSPRGRTHRAHGPSSAGESWEDLLRQRARRLARARGLAFREAFLDVSLLARHVLNTDAAGMILRETEIADRKTVAALDALLGRRLAGEPVSRILGRREFLGREFLVTPAVLDPRADTEILVEAALEGLGLLGREDRGGAGDFLKVLDVGTGSGAIVISLLAEHPGLFAVATDISEAALAVAMRNACRHEVAGRLHLLRRSWLRGVSGAFDLVVSNPPYVRSADLATLPEEVRLHDPLPALDGGRDGLAAYRELAAGVGDVLRPGGLVMVECGHDQAKDATAIFRAAGLVPHPALPTPRRDLAGRERVIILQKR